jgi:hypothetical protein
MRFALIDNNRTEAQPKLNGLCCCCSKPVVQNVVHEKYGIGHIKAKRIVTIGGNQKQSGTELGKTIIHPIGRNIFV